ncbi:unnamed protein product [Urochloa humidicola]
MKPTTVAANFHNNSMDAADKPDAGSGAIVRPSHTCYLVILSTALWALVFFVMHSSTQGGDGGVVLSAFFKPSAFSSLPMLSSIPVGEGGQQPPASVTQVNRSVAAPANRCAGRYIYMYDLPPRFNEDLVRGCRKLSPWMDMCPYVSNCGMGPALGDEGGVFQPRGWYATDQFTLEIISHCRMRRHECLTGDPTLAAAVYVPFYAAMDAGRYFFNSTSARDALALDLADWLMRRPEWRAMGGRDHFGPVRFLKICSRPGTVPGQDPVDPVSSLNPGLFLNPVQEPFQLPKTVCSAGQEQKHTPALTTNYSC